MFDSKILSQSQDKIQQMKNSSFLSSITSFNNQEEHGRYYRSGTLAKICREQVVTESSRRFQMLKMLLLTLVPILLLWSFNFYVLSEIVTQRAKTKQSLMDIRSSLSIGSLVHHLQKERDMSILYLSALGPETKSFLLAEYIDTDAVINSVNIWPDNFSEFGMAMTSKESLMAYLAQHRQALSRHGKSNFFQELNFYNNIIDAMLLWLTDTLNQDRFSFIWKSLVAYVKISIGKHNVGAERALGTMFFVQGYFEDSEAFEMYNRKVNTFSAFYYTAEMYSDSVSNMYREGYLNAGYNVSANIHLLRQDILRGQLQEGQSDVAKAKIWFDNMTNYMDALYSIQNTLGNDLISKTEEILSSVNKTMAVAIAILVSAIIICPIVIAFVQSLTSHIQHYALSLVTKTKELSKEKKKIDSLLYQMMPRSVADRLKKKQNIEAEYFKSSTIMFSDIHQFSKIASECTPMEIVELLNSLYTSIDEKLDNYDVYKVETINDCYMVVSGVPKRNSNQHAKNIANLSLDLLNMMNQKTFLGSDRNHLSLRIGINTGPCMAGVVGIALPRYCLFGDSVNTASRMKTFGAAGRIHISQTTYKKLNKLQCFVMNKRGIIQVKGKGEMETYWLMGKMTDSRTAVYDQTHLPNSSFEPEMVAVGEIHHRTTSDKMLKTPLKHFAPHIFQDMRTDLKPTKSSSFKRGRKSVTRMLSADNAVNGKEGKASPKLRKISNSVSPWKQADTQNSKPKATNAFERHDDDHRKGAEENEVTTIESSSLEK